jgi:phosphoribosyl-dephospho-CoA transferase
VTSIKDAARNKGADAAEEEHRHELLRLLDVLQRETAQLSKTHREAAARVARRAEAFAQEANRAEHNHRLLKHAVEDLKKSVEQFENSHPRLVQTVGTISATLANMGI